MSKSLPQIIQERLVTIEREEKVVVCLAVESGSRAWGFASADSDYDVRFIYVHRPEWYLSIDLEDRRDVIERPIEGKLDVSGWDIRKALKLFRKSNPPLIEWLQCPLVYTERSSLATRLRSLLPTYYSPSASYHHYCHMAQNNFREYLKGDIVRLKKYFYALRPLLAIRWIEADLGPVPIEFGRLVEATIRDVRLRKEIDSLLTAKKAGAELDRGPRIEPISRFIENEMARHEQALGQKPSPAPPPDALNDLFRDLLKEVWPAG